MKFKGEDQLVRHSHKHLFFTQMFKFWFPGAHTKTSKVTISVCVDSFRESPTSLFERCALVSFSACLPNASAPDGLLDTWQTLNVHHSRPWSMKAAEVLVHIETWCLRFENGLHAKLVSKLPRHDQPLQQTVLVGPRCLRLKFRLALHKIDCNRTPHPRRRSVNRRKNSCPP